jgi:hypothetical protein
MASFTLKSEIHVPAARKLRRAAGKGYGIYEHAAEFLRVRLAGKPKLFIYFAPVPAAAK